MGDISFLNQRIMQAFDRVRQHLRITNPELLDEQAKDLAVVSGIARAIMGLKLIQLLPGLPVAQGNKNLLIVPLFLLTAQLTTSRLGGFWTGCTVGIINFMLGYGKYGILELFQFIIPGILADLLLPFVRGSSRSLLLVQYGLVGGILGLARFAANIAVIILAGAPSAAFLFYIPMMVSQVVFGIVSALVSLLLLDKCNSEFSLCTNKQ